jgi:hypothetical protein
MPALADHVRAERIGCARMGAAMNEKQRLRQLAKLGIEDFETLEDVERMQRDLLQRLNKSSIDPDHYAGLATCRLDHCGRVNCLEACWFGTCRRRLNEIPIIHDLLQNSHKPLYEVRLVRSAWVGPTKELPHAPIAAAKNTNTRCLDKLFIPTLVAVGMFKVSVQQLDDKHFWIYEIHQIVAGAEKDQLENVFSSSRQGAAITNKFWTQEVTELGSTISKVFRRDLQAWQDPEWAGAELERPTKLQRREFYSWLLNLNPGARLIRYGCDQRFNKLEKKPRTFRATVRKPRPYPYHLKKYMFGATEDSGEKYDPDELPGDRLKARPPWKRGWFHG